MFLKEKKCCIFSGGKWNSRSGHKIGKCSFKDKEGAQCTGSVTYYGSVNNSSVGAIMCTKHGDSDNKSPAPKSWLSKNNNAFNVGIAGSSSNPGTMAGGAAFETDRVVTSNTQTCKVKVDEKGDLVKVIDREKL